RIGLPALGLRARSTGERWLLDPRRQRACGRGRRHTLPERVRAERSLAAALSAAAAARGIRRIRGGGGSIASRRPAAPRRAERGGTILSAGGPRDAVSGAPQLHPIRSLSGADAHSRTRLMPAARPRQGFASWPTRPPDPPP